MNYSESLDKFLPRSRRAFAAGGLIAFLVLTVTVVVGLLFVRSLVRGQMMLRDAEALYATTLMEQLDLSPEGEGEMRTAMQVGFDSAVRASRLRGVMGIRFFDTEGRFHDTFPATIMPQPLEAKALDAVRRFEPHSRFSAGTRMDSIFIYREEFAAGRIAQVATLQITIPMHRRNRYELIGAAQFIVEGESIGAEFRRLDYRLVEIGLMTLAMAGGLLMVMLWPAYRRVRRLNREVKIHSERLQRANEELALAARVSAVGAVSAHLMHGLKNPLASLSQFVSRNDQGAAEADALDWEDALTASRRMQSIVEHTLEVLSDVKGEVSYELTVPELGEELQRRVSGFAAEHRVDVTFEAEGNCTLSSRTANLASLVLVNLLDNAIEATSPGGTVSLSVSRNGDRLLFRVRDEGVGFPREQIDHLFLPGKSTHEGGSGIGLAISKQIADYLKAILELEETSEKGCVFLFDMSLNVCQDRFE